MSVNKNGRHFLLDSSMVPHYLKAENQILRSLLPKQIQTTPAERSLLVRLGAPLGSAVQEILSVVHYKVRS